MTKILKFITKEKWHIRFVPWKKCETGIAIQCDAEFTLKEFKEFYLDLWKAMFKRYETNFPWKVCGIGLSMGNKEDT